MHESNIITAAQICIDGHIITSNIELSHLQKNFCLDCGKPTITACQKCNSPIQGALVTKLWRSSSFVDKPSAPAIYSCELPLPMYCHNCGNPYPWTENKISIISDILLELDDLNPEEVQRVIDLIPDIVVETPKTDLAKVRLQKLFKGAKSQTVSILQNMIANFACEAIKLFFNL